MHPIISTAWIDRIRLLFHAIELVLALHYATNTTDPVLARLLDTASLYANLRINFAHFEIILYLVPGFYLVYPDYQQVDAVNLYRIAPPKRVLVFEFTKSIDTRRTQFNDAMEKWLAENQHLGYIPAVEIRDVAMKNYTKPLANSPAKKMSPSPTKVNKLKNDVSRFRFKERLEHAELAKTGMSLLERIRLKEKLRNSENPATPQQKYDTYIAGKLQPVYNILYQICSREPLPKLFLMTKLIGIVRDSFSYPIAILEVQDTLHTLDEILPSLSIITKAGTTVVRVESVDRSRDLERIERKAENGKDQKQLEQCSKAE